jgi:2-keto-4-pentenoate hydratase/2-oxohepta-3-ene-1,7-dioic acid hydratase in catechol pathway
MRSLEGIVFPLRFDVNGEVVEVLVTTLLNGGYAGRSQEDVAAHVAELAELGVPAPTKTPCLYPVAPYLAMQPDEVPVQHGRTSGEAEWALIVAGPDERDVLLTVACDHTDRQLEVHGVAWSKQAGPDVLGRKAWRLVDVAERLDELTLTAWAGGERIQRGTLAELLTPHFWLDDLRERGLLRPGTVLLSGTIPMDAAVDQFAGSWRVELGDPKTGDVIACEYQVRRMPEPVA